MHYTAFGIIIKTLSNKKIDLRKAEKFSGNFSWNEIACGWRKSNLRNFLLKTKNSKIFSAIKSKSFHDFLRQNIIFSMLPKVDGEESRFDEFSHLRLSRTTTPATKNKSAATLRHEISWNESEIMGWLMMKFWIEFAYLIPYIMYKFSSGFMLWLDWHF